MRIAIASLFALLAVASAAHAADSYRFGSQVLTVGDTAGKLQELAGEPVHKEPIENRFGAHEGERWEYRRDGKTLLVTIKDGKVDGLREIY